MAHSVANLLLVSVSGLADGAAWTKEAGVNCYSGHGATDLEKIPGKPCGSMPLGACQQLCNDLPGCTGVTVAGSGGDVQCFRRGNITLGLCDHGTTYDTYVRSGAPSPDKAMFIAVGDWGYSSSCHGNVKSTCQGLIAEAMKDVMEKGAGLVKFVVNVGDSFYCDGVTGDGDPKWQSYWKDVYGDADPSRDLTSLPWYSVYGNHDMGNQDPCPCGDPSSCNQVNNSVPNWVMPDLTYHVAREDLGVELIGLDTNVDWQNEICDYVPCGSTCQATLQKRTDDAVRYFADRYEQSPAKTLIVFSHYPTDYLEGPQKALFTQLSDGSKHGVVYFGGHRHNTDQNAPSIAPNTQWLVGGGGGYGCDGGQQGVVLGHIAADGTVSTEAKLVDANACCDFAGDAEAAVGTSIEAVHCTADGECANTTAPQGRCLRGGGGGMYRLWCETSKLVKVDAMREGCGAAVRWHFVPQGRSVRSVGGGTVSFHCGRPHRRATPNPAVPVPDPGAVDVRTITWGQ